jgi:lipopolysaccharide biosynthesis regulator YciM
MRLWTTVKLILLLAILVVLAFIADANQHILAQEFKLFRGYHMPTFLVIFLAFALGLLVSVMMLGLREAEALAGKWRRRGGKKEATRADALTFAAMDAIMEARLADAKRLLTDALRIQPDHPHARLRLGHVHRLEERAEEALREHRTLLAQTPEAWAPQVEIARDLMALERRDEAVDTMHRALKQHPARWEEGNLLLLDIHMAAGEWDRAQDVYEQVQKRAESERHEAPRPECKHVLPYCKAAALIEAKDFKGAEKILRRLVKEHPKFAPAYVALGKARMFLGREGEGVETWVDGMRVTGSLAFLPMLEEHFLATERPDKALDAFRGIAASEKNNVLSQFLLGRLYHRLEMMDEAYKQFRTIESRVSRSPTFHYFMGKLQERRGALPEALESYKRVIEESGVLALQYVCRRCGASSESWSDRCERCRTWGNMELDFRTELTPDEMGLAEAPVYSAASGHLG